MAYDHITGQGIGYTGIIFTDFIGEVILTNVIAMNGNRFQPCSADLISQGCTYCQSSTTCKGCNTTENYIYLTSNSSCAAADGYYLLWNTATSNTPTLC